MTDVFISYARADRDRVRHIAHALTAEGFSVWWDPEIKPGKKWNDLIRRTLDNAAVVIACWTPASAKSQWVAAETHHGHARRVLVPIMLKSCHPPIPFNMIQSADLTRWRGRPEDPEWRAVLGEVRRLVEAKRRLSAAVPPAEEAEALRYAAAGASGSYAPDYRPSAKHGRMGPRALPMILGTMAALIVLTAGLWAGDYALDRLRGDPAATDVETVLGEAAPSEAVAPAAAAPEAPATGIEPAQPSVTTPPPATTPVATTPVAPTPSAPDALPGDDPAAIPILETCALRWVEACPAGRGRRPYNFTQDRRLSEAERRFLNGLGVPVSPATMENAQLCTRRNGGDFTRACGSVVWSSAPAGPAPYAPAEATGEDGPSLPAAQISDALRQVRDRQPPPEPQRQPSPNDQPSRPGRD